MEDFVFKYNEENLLQELREYIIKTYTEHYAGEKGQLFDLFQNAGLLQSYCIASGSKYLLRYGKKNGYNREDLVKAVHVALISLYCHDERIKNETNTTL